jgi:hypothetical protein
MLYPDNKIVMCNTIRQYKHAHTNNRTKEMALSTALALKDRFLKPKTIFLSVVSVVTLETRVPRALPSFGRENFVIGSSGDQWVKFRIGGCVSHSWQIPCPLPPHPTSHLSRTTRGVPEVELQSRTQRRERKRTGTCRLSSSNKMRPI